MTDFTFSDRATWIAYRAEWKARYKKASQNIRALKHAMVENRGNDNSDHQRNLHYARITANDLMIELTEAKEFKAQQFAARTAVAA